MWRHHLYGHPWAHIALYLSLEGTSCPECLYSCLSLLVVGEEAELWCHIKHPCSLHPAVLLLWEQRCLDWWGFPPFLHILCLTWGMGSTVELPAEVKVSIILASLTLLSGTQPCERVLGLSRFSVNCDTLGGGLPLRHTRTRSCFSIRCKGFRSY